jgi:hypothetical protein
VAVQNHGEKEEHQTETEVFQTEWWSLVTATIILK